MAAGIVGAVLLLAGVSKMASSAVLPGLPRWVSSLVPVAELVVGALLLAGFRLAAVAALVLLAGFTVWLLRRLARGDRRPCACFGEAGAVPVSAWSVARNVVLLGAAVLVLAGFDGPAGWPGRMLGAGLGAVVVVAERSRPRAAPGQSGNGK